MLCVPWLESPATKDLVVTSIAKLVLDSGSYGDVLFVKKGSKEIAYTKQLIPQVWQSLMGHFKTDKVEEVIELKFVKYSENKRVSISSDIMEYDEDNYDPKFELIIATQTMQELGIILNFSTNMVVIDEIKPPMRKKRTAKTKCSVPNVQKSGNFFGF